MSGGLEIGTDRSRTVENASRRRAAADKPLSIRADVALTGTAANVNIYSYLPFIVGSRTTIFNAGIVITVFVCPPCTGSALHPPPYGNVIRRRSSSDHRSAMKMVKKFAGWFWKKLWWAWYLAFVLVICYIRDCMRKKPIWDRGKLFLVSERCVRRRQCRFCVKARVKRKII